MASGGKPRLRRAVRVNSLGSSQSLRAWEGKSEQPGIVPVTEGVGRGSFTYHVSHSF